MSRQRPSVRISLPPCPDCGIVDELRFTRAHDKNCVKPRRIREEAARRERERIARAFFRRG